MRLERPARPLFSIWWDQTPLNLIFKYLARTNPGICNNRFIAVIFCFGCEEESIQPRLVRRVQPICVRVYPMGPRKYYNKKRDER